MDLRGRVALVTGAASGIGRETALAFARAGADLVVCDLNDAGLEATAEAIRAVGRTALDRRVDVSSREEMRAFAAEVHRQHGAVDVLMNNAGVGLGGGFLDTSLEDWEWILSINLWGVIHGCHYFLPPMVARGRGHVVNVSSAAGYLATAQLAAYSTTKFGVFGLSEALRDELRPHGIGVTTVCPGIINTPITGAARMRGAVATPEARAALVDIYRRRNYGPERVAANILKAVARNRSVAPISPEAWVMYLMKRVSPGLTARINRALQARMEKQMLGATPARASRADDSS
ncbi:MAG TPA: SDR family NAD(P)-dependent oxidoreductase [Candidatus Binatus sp.]|nr:SDR family NAD(P)-dependent oxidoreductase [Candidatus Binatus sp.]